MSSILNYFKERSSESETSILEKSESIQVSDTVCAKQSRILGRDPGAVSDTVAIMKPARGGVAFWRSLITLLKDGVSEFQVTALQLHSKAWLYMVPCKVLNLEAGSLHNFSIVILAEKPRIQKFTLRKQLTVKVHEQKVTDEYGWTRNVKWLEIVRSDGFTFKVYTNPKDRRIVEGKQHAQA